MNEDLTNKKIEGNKAWYQLRCQLGVGGFGQTWKADITHIKKSKQWLVEPGPSQSTLVAIKWANIQKNFSPEDNRRFLQDVNSAINSELVALNLLADLTCVARIYDFGHIVLQLSDGSPQVAIFLVEEFLEGTRFDTYLLENYGEGSGANRTFTGIKNSKVFLNYATILATAVREIHHRGVIHGDIWPENIMVKEAKDLRFFDLGASAIRDTAFLLPNGFDMQRSDSYCAPERRLGERHGRRSDIYSLGGLFYFMATGKNSSPSMPDVDEMKNNIVSGINKVNPELIVSNCGIADVIARCLRYNKDQRIRDADALLNELRLFSFSYSNEGAQDHSEKDCVACLLGTGNGIDSLFSRMLKMDAACLKSRVDDVRRGILEVSGDHEELVLGMSTYLSVLDENDAFFVRTTPRFWKTENMGINGRFLSMVKLVAQRGTKVNHLMLVCESDRSDVQNRRILEAHLAAMKQVEFTTKERLEFFCKFVSADERQRVTRDTRWECCYAISREEVKAIQPVYDRNDILRTVRFVRQKHATPEQVQNDFQKELSGVVSLQSWLSEVIPANNAMHSDGAPRRR